MLTDLNAKSLFKQLAEVMVKMEENDAQNGYGTKTVDFRGVGKTLAAHAPPPWA